MKNIYRLSCILILLASAALQVQPARADSTIIVDSADDLIGVDSVCTLPEAIQNANDNAQTNGDCIGGSGIDTITFAANYIITLSGQLPAVTSAIIINGNGTGSTIIQANASPNTATYRIFEVSSTGNLTLNNLTVQNGRCNGSCSTDANAGGGIYNGGTLTLTNSILISNSSYATGGGIYNYGGTMTVTHSVLSSNFSPYGGGIFSIGGTLTVQTNSTFSANVAFYSGGGLYNYLGTLTVTNATFTGNNANSINGGGIYNDSALVNTVMGSTFSGNTAAAGSGGAIFNNTGGVLTVTTSTFNANNTAINGGAIFNYAATLTVTNSTLSGNSATSGGGGVLNLGTLSITNSTLSGNSATDNGGGIFNAAGTLNVRSSTLSGNSSANGGGINNVGTLNYVNTIIANSSAGGDCLNSGLIGFINNNLVKDGTCSAALSGDPKLAPLAANGGATQTFALLTGSPAIDAGDDASCAAAPVSNTSQNGLTRPQGTHCDIGSYEAPAYTLAIVSDHGTVTKNPDKPSYHEGDVVQLSATPNANWSFAGWSGGLTGTANPGFVTIHSNTSVTANYAPISYSLTLKSNGAQDGWVLESSETSNKGGSLNKTASTFNLGDDAGRRQYRDILSFATGAGLPDTAVITAVTLKVRKQAVIGGNPVTMFRGFMVDLKTGTFGTSALQTSDFQAAASQTLGPFTPTPVTGWYSIDLSGASASINKLGSGLTQIRLRFRLDDNNNAIANYLSLYSGNAAPSSRPQLVITYYVP